MLCCISNCIYFSQHHFCIDTLHYYTLIIYCLFRPSTIIRYTYKLTIGCIVQPLHWPLFTGYIQCSLLDILGCNATIYVLVKMLNNKIVKLLKFLESWIVKSFYYKSFVVSVDIFFIFVLVICMSIYIIKNRTELNIQKEQNSYNKMTLDFNNILKLVII
jgi:hypothetical protein